MANVQEHLQDNQDNLEKKSGSLSKQEVNNLDTIKLKTDVIDNAQKTVFQVKTKEGTPISVSAKVLMKAIARAIPLAEGRNYKEKMESANIKLFMGGKPYEVNTAELGRGSEVMALLQVAAGGNLVPDGKFGQATADAFSKFLTKTETKTESIKSNTEYLEGNDLFDKNMRVILGRAGEKTTDFLATKYEVFRTEGDKIGYLDGKVIVKGKEKTILVSYTSGYNNGDYGKRGIISFTYPDISDAKGINTTKLLNTIDSKIKEKETDLKKQSDKETAEKNADTLTSSAEKALNNVEIAKFGNPLVQEFLQKTQSFSNAPVKFVDFDMNNGRSNGIIIKNNTVSISAPGLSIFSKLSVYKKTDNTFDTDKFIKDITNKLIPLAKNWKKESISSTYNSYKGDKVDQTNIKDCDKLLNKYTVFQKDINSAKTQGVVIDQTIIDSVSKNIDGLNKQKNYLVAKNWINTEVTDLEERYQDAKGPVAVEIQTKAFNRAAQFKRSDIMFQKSNIAVEASFKAAGKATEFDQYIERYKKMFARADLVEYEKIKSID